jgi:DNA mismatch repair protein MutL
MSTPEIRELDEQTVERIAAGEVVERPASAVKELVENSLDADASRVTVAVESGGTDLVRVTDDGVGMDEQTLRQAIEKHTTSKIRDIDDLSGGVGTLGFRGEALHAIGAVSRLRLRSRPRDGGRGTELTVEGGEVTDVSPVGCPAGTTVAVRDLFYNVPARRKYLKTDSTEFSHVGTVVTNYALANPDVAVTLEHNGREQFATTGSGDRREAVLSVYGREVAESMLPVGDSSEGPTGPLRAVSGLVSHPETNRSSREYLSTFVNGRYVTANTVRTAVVDAYDGQLAADRYPFAVLFLEVDPATVDVNVHPRKLEVRFADDEAVREQVRDTVEAALLDAGLLRSSAPRGRSAPDQTRIEPSSTSDGATDAGDTDTATVEGTTPDTSSDTDTASNITSDTDAGDTDATADSTSNTSTGDGDTARPSRGPDTSHPTLSSGDEPSDRTAGSTGSSSPDSRRSAAGDEPNTQTTLQGDPAHPPTGYATLPDLRVLGQLGDTYVVAEAEDGLVLIDQHAADERINYERLADRFDGDVTTQALAEPVAVELTAGEVTLFEDHRDALARLGFRATLVDDRTVEVTTVPAPVAEAAGPAVIRDVLTDLVDGERAAEDTVEAVADDLLSDMACYPSITGNTSLTEGSVVDLLSALDDCTNPWACPHGRPVLIHIDGDEIDDRFERDYPGH